MVPLIITLLQWEFVVTTMVIFFSVFSRGLPLAGREQEKEERKDKMEIFGYGCI